MDEETLFAAVLERTSSGDWRDFLDQACVGNITLRQRVERLLAHEKAHGILDELDTLVGTTRETDGSRPERIVPGERPGAVLADRYTLLEPIGEGGMGTVWAAEQTVPVRRKVAVKLVRAGMASKSILARIEVERQALALMDHPNIAKVLDGGTTEDGPPFFVMEYVAGVPITQHCDEARLSIRERLELFVLVCQAVQHAHTKGIIHRDLKPSNVLVGIYDGVPIPKVIDFGVAKATDPGLVGATTLTGVGQLIGTPLYMSPEQAETGGLDIDTRTDIYSLGVLLYELLTGSTPFQASGMGEAAFYRILRVIREEEPETPSRRLAATQELTSIAARRRAEPSRLGSLIRGDLDWIVMKAIEKDRDRRYETAKGLSLDLGRYLADDVVLARPPSTGYRLRKFVRRNKGLVAAATALVASLVVGSGAVVAVKARADRERADAAARLAMRDARATASIAAAVREARERSEEAWSEADDPDRMRQSTDAVEAAVRRARIFAGGESTNAATLAELAATSRAADDLARYTSLIAAGDDNRQKFAAELTGQNPLRARVGYCERQSKAFRRFGLDPLEGPADEVARQVATSRLRDALLGMLLEWHGHAAAVSEARQKDPARVPDTPVADRRVEERLGQVVRSARRISGGGHARWQDLLDRGDVAGLVAFAGSPEALEFRSGLAAALGRDLERAGQYAAMRALLRAAVERYPREPWLHFDLAYSSARGLQPPEYAEALRHMSAATVLRPDSVLFYLYLSEIYAGLGSYERAIAAHRQAIRLAPGSANVRRYLGHFLLNRKDWDGAIAAFREAIRLKSDDAAAYNGLGTALVGAGRPAEGLRVALDGLQRNPAQVDDSRNYLRYNTACLVLTCANGKGENDLPPAERATYRKKALDLLTAELASLRRLAETDPAWVHRRMQHWLEDTDLTSVREADAGALEHLPDDEREAWRRLWAEVRDLRNAAAPKSHLPRTGE